MAWYVRRNGEMVGPIGRRDVADWVRGGMVDALVRDGEYAPWHFVADSPFAEMIPYDIRGRAPRGSEPYVAENTMSLGRKLVVGALLSILVVLFLVGLSDYAEREAREKETAKAAAVTRYEQEQRDEQGRRQLAAERQRQQDEEERLALEQRERTRRRSQEAIDALLEMQRQQAVRDAYGDQPVYASPVQAPAAPPQYAPPPTWGEPQDMSKPVHVKEYTRRDGTVVHEHTRSAPHRR